MPDFENKISVSSEISTLKRVLIHSPDSGIGKVIPSKAQDWLFEDIVHLDTIRRKEYDYYVKILLYFLDPEKIQGKLAQIDDPKNEFEFYHPDNDRFHQSDKVIELQWLLSDILKSDSIKKALIASVCALENCSYVLQNELELISPFELSKIFITGSMPNGEMIFPPVPNFIFTRDIGIIINRHILLNKPAKKARSREALLAKYIFYNHPAFEPVRENIIELPNLSHHFLLPIDNDTRKVTLEGGDVMVVSKNHVLIGISERTSLEAAHHCIQILFQKNVVEKVTVLTIPKKRDYMHIDTIFTQVKRNVWVLLGLFSKKAVLEMKADLLQRTLIGDKKENQIIIRQFIKSDIENLIEFESLEDLLENISKVDLKCSEAVKFIYSGNNEFPFDAREQWTDSCNLLAIKEGVVLGYDRNEKTMEAFSNEGFSIAPVAVLLEQLESGAVTTQQIENMVITMPSAELSRARGGFHCMSMPLLRDNI